MRHDRNGGKRTNWLLIKHRDDFAREGKANNILDEADQSVASGRAMDQIAAGKGKAPTPFMTAKSSRGKADAVWNSNRGDAAEARAARKGRGGAAYDRQGFDPQNFDLGLQKPKRSRRCRISSRRSFVFPSIARRAERDGATRSSSTATGCNCGSRTARPP